MSQPTQKIPRCLVLIHRQYLHESRRNFKQHVSSQFGITHTLRHRLNSKEESS